MLESMLDADNCTRNTSRHLYVVASSMLLKKKSLLANIREAYDCSLRGTHPFAREFVLLENVLQ